MDLSHFTPKVLIIDDEEVVRDSIREILIVKETANVELELAAGDLFDDLEPVPQKPPRRYHPAFKVDEATNGKAGLELVKKALAAGDPYSVIFCDMRMPGWDGLQTTIEIRKVDPKVQIFFVTAYSDRSLDEIVAQAGSDVGYLSKPFIPEEILQLATKAVYDWQRLSNLEYLLQVVSQIGVGRSHLNTLLSNLLHQISDYLKTDFAILGKLGPGMTFSEVSRIGLGEPLDIDRLLLRVVAEDMQQLELVDNVVICRMDEYCVFALHPEGAVFNQEKAYLLQLFLQNAIRSIQNATLNQQLVRQEKLSAVGQAMSMVMHDIKTPISQIQSLTELIQMEVEDEPDTLEMTEMIFEASQHALNIIGDMRDFVQNAELPKEDIDFQAFMSSIEAEMKPLLAEARVGLQVSVSEALHMQGDPRKLRRVFVNLINNASEALQGAGTANPRIRLSAEAVDGRIEAKVADNGPGIPPAIQARLFDAFVTSGKATGTGLGLAIAKQVVEAHDGTISVTSSPEGATFHISLPLT
ncbi:MAG: response regulator [Bacteroidetes bacterium]|nr:MAG: response regulator [Bacteroidota bacterium]